MIDTDILIEGVKERLNFPEKMKGRGDEHALISVITASELLHGVWRANDVNIRQKRSEFVEHILKTFPIMPINLIVARVHAQMWAGLKSQGILIGLHDSWIAATCLAYEYTLVTNNFREFQKIHGLNVESW